MSKLTTAQKFQIVLIVLGALVGGASQLEGIGLSEHAVTSITSAAGLLVVIVSGVGTVMTGQSMQAQSIAAAIDDPSVKAIVVPAVAHLPGVEHIRTNAQADATLKAMADSQMPDLAKIVPPK